MHSIRTFVYISIPANVSLCQAKQSITTSSINLLQLNSDLLPPMQATFLRLFLQFFTHHFPYLQLPICFKHCEVGLYLTAGFRGLNPPTTHPTTWEKKKSSSWYNIILKSNCRGKEGRKFTYISHTHRLESLIHNRPIQWTASDRFSHKGLTILYQLQFLLLYCLWSI